MDKEALKSGSAGLGLNLSDHQVDQFESFEEALYSQNAIMNLTRVPREECVTRHFLDCLILSPLIAESSTVLDVGTGPGLPAWPIAAARPDLTVVALDSSNKYIRFLESQPLPNLELILARGEEFAAVETFDFVTGRAVAPLSIQLELSIKAAKIGGLVAPMRSSLEEFEGTAEIIKTLKLKLLEVKVIRVPHTDVVRKIPLYQKVAKTPARFPRTWAEMKKNPL